MRLCLWLLFNALLAIINDLLREEFDCDRDEIIIVERKY